MKHFFRYIVGILIGAGAILPGISSGVICVVCGIYEKLLNCVLNIFKDWKKNFIYLFPIGLGIITGIILFGNILKYLFNTFNMPTCFAFMGLILGSSSLIIKQINVKKNLLLHILYFILTLSISLFLFFIELKSNTFSSNASCVPSHFKLIISGFFMSAGIVIPGVSSSVILMLVGIYETYLDAVSNFNLLILIPMGIGVLTGSFIFLKTIKFLLDNFKTYTYFSIIGFAIGSISVFYPGFEFNNTGFFSILIFIFCFFMSQHIGKLE